MESVKETKDIIAAKQNNMSQEEPKKCKGWRKYHRWGGIICCVFMLVFCFSGIILNHRSTYSGVDVPRWFMPPAYHIENYNNGTIRGTLGLGGDSVLGFGNCGVWLTDKGFNRLADFNNGFPEGVDNRNIRNIVRTREGILWCATQSGLYRHHDGKWLETALPGNTERLSDVCLTPDSNGVVAVTRTRFFVQDGDGGFKSLRLGEPDIDISEVSLFKTIWNLHSGQLFGLPGKIIVDLLAIILAFLSMGGILIFILPYPIRARTRKHLKATRKIRVFRWNVKWHNSVGYVTLPLTLLIVLTGMCLRPPLMVPFVLNSTKPLPASTMDTGDKWHDRLRALRFDADSDTWLLSTSEGFFRLDSLNGRPRIIPKDKVPPVSPMGITVFEHTAPDKWLIGSFSGLFRWNPSTGQSRDYFTDEIFDSSEAGGFILSDHLVSGYSHDLNENTVFDYAEGSDSKLPESELLRSQPMSLWNFALELHVGRCYDPFLGPLSSMFVFISGVAILLVLVSGYIIHRRMKRR